MNLSWGNLDVRVYAAEAWVSLAPRFAADNPIIVDQLERTLSDPVPAVRLQAAQNLQVICVAAPHRMWTMAERLAANEPDPKILAAYLGRSLRRFSHNEPERCEDILKLAKDRFDAGFGDGIEGRDHLQETFGWWAAQLFAGQGRPLMRDWLAKWAKEPNRYGALLNSYASSLRNAFFHRYATQPEPEAVDVCNRAQEGLELIVRPALALSAEAYRVLISDREGEEREAAVENYRGAESVIHHAMNQLYFGSGAHNRQSMSEDDGLGLPDDAAKRQFLSDYDHLLKLFATSHEPSTLHHLIELYEFLILGDPIGVFEAIHSILLGRGKEEGYQFETLGMSAVVRIVRRYIADHRAIFEDEGRRARLVAILQLFSDVGWHDALKLLYELPDLLR